MPEETVTEGVVVGPPSATGFGPREDADATRQAQQGFTNDTPTDVNFNALVAREQSGTYVLMGKNFEANAMRFNGLMDHFAANLAKQ